MLKKIYHLIVPEFFRQKIRESSPYYNSFRELRKYAEDLNLQIADKNQEITRLAEEKQSQEETLNLLIHTKDQEIKKISAEKQQLNQQVRAKDQEIEKINAEKQAQTENLIQQICAKDQEIEKISAEKQQLNQQVRAKDQEIEKINAEKQAQTENLIQQTHAKDQENEKINAEKQQLNQQVRAKDQEIEKINAEKQAQTENLIQQICAKDQEIEKISAEKQQLNQQVRAKDQVIEKINAEKQMQIENLIQQTHAKDQENEKAVADWKKQEELWKARLLSNYEDYQASLKKLLHDPDIREDHLCGICGNLMQFSFSKKIMNKYEIAYFTCEHCRHVQTEKPYWLKEAYDSALSDSDTGQIWRNERNRDIVCAVAQRFLSPSPKVLEYAGGYGLLTRMLRDAGMECRWYDKYAENTFARHFEDDGKQQYDLVLAFEALEHFEDPMKELENIFRCGASLIFSEVLLPDLCPNQWWYLCTEHGQHVNFYSLQTLQYIADHFHRKLYMHEDVGIITSLEITQEEFADTLTHAGEHARTFRESHPSLTMDDMNTVIKTMERQ